jgi:hypothetical protein
MRLNTSKILILQHYHVCDVLNYRRKEIGAFTANKILQSAGRIDHVHTQSSSSSKSLLILFLKNACLLNAAHWHYFQAISINDEAHFSPWFDIPPFADCAWNDHLKIGGGLLLYPYFTILIFANILIFAT